MQSTGGLTREQRGRYHDDGFVRLPGFAPREVCQRMLDRVIEIARAHAAGEPGAPGLVLPEANLAGSTGDPEDHVSKIFRLHRDGVFADVAGSRGLTDLLADLIGARIDCFLSQFIFKNPAPGASPGTRTASTSGSSRPGPSSVPGWPSPRPPCTTAACTCSRARTTRLSTATSPTAVPAPTSATSRSSTTT